MQRIRFGITLGFILALLLCGWRGPAAAGHAQKQRFLTEEFHLYQKVGSQFLPTQRDIIVWMPPGYEAETERRYPVLYMHDGGTVFAQWRIDEIAKPLIAAREVEPLLIVMVGNGGTQEARFDEYTPTRPPGFRSGGKADAQGRMLVEEIKPFIDTQYRTRPGPADTALGGVSLGGLVTLYLGLKHPTVFGKLAVMSPSVWWDNRLILRHVKKLESRPAAMRIWLDIGTEEGPRSISDVKDLRDALVKKGWTLDSDLKYFEAKGGRHDEESFAKRAGTVLKYLFPPPAGAAPR